MMPRCKQITFKSSRRRMEGSLVQVDSECEEIAPGQEVRVKVQTLPELCGVRWTGTFQGPECSSGDLRNQVPQCITGSLHYELHPGGGGLTVEVSDMLEDSDYRLRLCLEGYVCTGTGANTLIKKEEAVKKGWSAVMDAPRVRVCPFKDRLTALWSGVTYAPMEGELSWQPACPVDVTVSLCLAGDEGVCEDQPGTAPQRTRGSKVTFSNVDPRPQLCVKWSMDSQCWTSCPFANKTFQGAKLCPTCAPSTATTTATTTTTTHPAEV
ncbi:hypothetical protein CRUP_035973 [Coryphaenoides rupestris]|nr:hypothetical protein CRUP_035973 [Coryphaenoides rupestris]